VRDQLERTGDYPCCSRILFRRLTAQCALPEVKAVGRTETGALALDNLIHRARWPAGFVLALVAGDRVPFVQASGLACLARVQRPARRLCACGVHTALMWLGSESTVEPDRASLCLARAGGAMAWLQVLLESLCVTWMLEGLVEGREGLREKRKSE
jgi:hypothetical protein